MQKRSHHLLASTLLKNRGGFSTRRYEWAFLFGSVQPDCNPLSYLKGSRRGRMLRGHHFPNSRLYVFRRIRSLQTCRRWTVLHYYTLGKLTHYLADAFTHPHNDISADNLTDHHRYESELRLYLANRLPLRPARQTAGTDDPIAEIESLHRQYLGHPADVRHDARYALLALELLMDGCCPPVF